MSTAKKKKVNRAAFGSVRQLPSGRWQARHRDAAGRSTAAGTFETKKEAETHLARIQVAQRDGTWHDRRDGKVLFTDYARQWIADGGSRGKLAERTAALYRSLLHRQLTTEVKPSFDGLQLAQITPALVRRWHAACLAQAGETQTRQAYVLGRAVLTTAVADGKVSVNPFQVKKAGTSAEKPRPELPLIAFFQIVAELPEYLQVPMQLLLGGHLRIGELLGLRVGDLDVEAGTIRIVRQRIRIHDRDPLTGAMLPVQEKETAPKADGERTVVLPPFTAQILREYVAAAGRRFPSVPLFTRPNGERITRFAVQHHWRRAADSLGFTEAHVHDARHLSLTVAAAEGDATLAELKARGGHRSTRAALVYQHAAEARRSTVADGISTAFEAAFRAASGTQVARSTADEVQIPVVMPIEGARSISR